LLDEIPDTLTGGNMLMHYAEGTVRSGILFAASCLFRVNSRTLVVTVPACWRPFESLDALSYYPKLLANRAMKHSIHLMEFRGDSFSISATPVDVKYTNNLPESTEQPYVRRQARFVRARTIEKQPWNRKRNKLQTGNRAVEGYGIVSSSERDKD
jgi:hypothetical protein